MIVLYGIAYVCVVYEEDNQVDIAHLEHYNACSVSLQHEGPQLTGNPRFGQNFVSKVHTVDAYPKQRYVKQKEERTDHRMLLPIMNDNF